jgi:2-polyprenyl-6-methoxyphenol hydroxylase-like FAD-dependent oxidoreductase
MKGRIGIVGGSIAGCAAAFAARRAGFEATVFERATNLRDRGLGVGMPVATYEDLTAAGYLDPGLPVHRVEHRLWVLAEPGEPTGRVLWRQPAQALAVNWGQLWCALADRAAPGYRGGERVTAAHDDGGITTEDGRTHAFDLVVGADGHKSLVRSRISPSTQPREAGYALWRGVVIEDHLPARLVDILASAFVTLVFPGGHAIFYLIPSGSGNRLLTWAVYTRPRRPECAGIEEIWKTVARFLPPAWADACRRSGVLCVHPVLDVMATSYVAGPFLLAGDAATLARPHAASGAVKAMLDAMSLEHALTTGADRAEALAVYDAERRPAGNQLVEVGRRLGYGMVERTPCWTSMTADDMPGWTAAVLGGHSHYLYQSQS